MEYRYEKKDLKRFGDLYEGDVFFTSDKRMWIKTVAVYVMQHSWDPPLKNKMTALSLDSDAGAICYVSDDELVKPINAEVVIKC